MVHQQFSQQLEQQLQTVVQSSDTQQIKVATSALNQMYATPDCVPALTEILVNQTTRPELRQIAAVELRKRCMKWWAKLEEQMGLQIKTALLEVCLKDGDKRIRHSTARIISEVAAVEMPAGKWQDLLQIVNTCTSSQNVLDREVGFYLIFALLDVIPDTFSQHLSQLLTLFEFGLQDGGSEDVRLYAMDSLAKLIDIMEPTDKAGVDQFRKLVPHMVQCLQRFIQADDEEKISSTIACFTAIISSDIPVFNQNIGELTQFFLGIGANESLSTETRTQSLSTLMWLILFKKNKLLRMKLVEPMIQALMRIGQEEEPEDMDEDSAARLSFKVLNTLASNVSPQQVFPCVWRLVSEFSSQPAVGARKSAMASLAAISEGCSDFIRNEFKVSRLIPLIVQALKDPEIQVRRAALIALSALTNDMGQEVCEYHSELLALVFGLLGDSNEYIRKVALETLDVILEHMGESIRPYLNDLMQQLLVALDQSNDVDSLNVIISAIGSAAHAAEKDFQPYFQHTYPRLEKFMQLANKDSDDEMTLRVNASDALGSVAIAVGKEMFAPHLQTCMQLSMNGLLMGAGRLPEAAFLFFGMMSKVFQQDFQPYLGPVMESIFTAAQVEEADASFNADGEEDLDVEDMNEELEKKWRFNSAIADEKEAAVDSLGVLVESTREAFLPYIQQSLNVVQELCDNSHDGVRKAAMEAFFKIVRTMHSLNPQNSGELIKLLMDECIRVYEEEDEIMAVANANTELLETLKLIGPHLVSQHLDALCLQLSSILQHKAICQLEFDATEEDDQPDDEAISEYDSLLISTAVDLIGGLAQACGEPFAQYVQQHFWKPICGFYGPAKPIADRSMVIGVIGEIANGLKSEISQFTNIALQLSLEALDDPDAEVRSNAAYAVGNICLYSKHYDVSVVYPMILQKLAVIFSNPQPLQNVVDNACGSVSRLLMAHPQMVPVDQVLPVLLQNLPLKSDFAENQPVYESLQMLWQQRNPILLQNLSHLIPIFSQVISAETTSDQVKLIVETMVKEIQSQ